MAFYIASNPPLPLGGNPQEVISELPESSPSTVFDILASVGNYITTPQPPLPTTRVPYKPNTEARCFGLITSGVVGDAAWIAKIEPDIVKLLITCVGAIKTDISIAGHTQITNEAEASAFYTSIERWVMGVVERILGKGSLTSLREVGKELNLQGGPDERLKLDVAITFSDGRVRTPAQILIEVKPPGTVGEADSQRFMENTSDTRNLHGQMRAYAKLFDELMITVIDGFNGKIVKFDRSYDGPVHVWHASYLQYPRLLMAQIFLKWYERELAASYYQASMKDYPHGIVYSKESALLVVLIQQQWRFSRDGSLVGDQPAVKYWQSVP